MSEIGLSKGLARAVSSEERDIVRTPQVAVSLENLHANISELDGVLGKLFDKLSPVLSPSPKEASQTGSTPESPVIVVREIDSATRRVINFIHYLNDVYSRLEI